MRFRVSRSELSQLIQSGRLEETIRFAPENDARLIYALENSTDQKQISLRYRPQEVTVLLPLVDAHQWLSGDQVGLYGECRVGDGVIALIVEKDFACLDGTDTENEDAFANPNKRAACQSNS